MEYVAGTWYPIETAPKTEEWVLLTGGEILYGWDGSDVPSVVSGQWTTYLNGRTVEGHWQFAWYDGGYYGEYVDPSHWSPLPKLAMEQQQPASPGGENLACKTPRYLIDSITVEKWTMVANTN